MPEQDYRTVVSVDAFTDLSSQYVFGVFGITEMQKVLEEVPEDFELQFEGPVVPRKNRTMWDERSA
jgi:hypothetical protein